MIHKYEWGFDIKWLGFYFGKFNPSYEIQEDIGKVYIAFRFFNKVFVPYKNFNTTLEKLWRHLLLKKLGYESKRINSSNPRNE